MVLLIHKSPLCISVEDYGFRAFYSETVSKFVGVGSLKAVLATSVSVRFVIIIHYGQENTKSYVNTVYVIFYAQILHVSFT